MQFGIPESVLHWGKYRSGTSAIHHNGQTTSYGEFNTLVDTLCYEISKANFYSERIGIAVKSKFLFLVSLISILRLGKSPVILNTGLSDEAIRTNLNDTKVLTLIYDEQHERIKLLIDSKEKQALNISRVIEDANLSLQQFTPPVIKQPHEEWGVLFSSGTTGVPKGIERDHNSIVTEILGWCLELNLNRQTSFYIGRPIYYTGGLLLSLSTLLVAGKIFLNDFKDDNDPDEIWIDYQNVLGSQPITWAFFVPDQIRAFIKIAEKLETPPLSAERILVMGAPIAGDEKVSASHLLHSVVIESWGNTESLGTITDDDDLEKRPNAIGRPFLTDQLCIVDENCNNLQPFQRGKIAGSEEAGFLKYSNRPEETKHVRRNELIISDDMGYTDKEGYFYVYGRDQDCILVNGETVFIHDIENKLRTNKNIKECCVVTSDPNIDVFELIGVIVLTPGISIKDTELLLQVNKTLGKKEQLNRILLIDSTPHLPSGKVDKVTIKRFIRDMK